MTFTQYTAYFDASGHPDDTEVMYVAGFVASERKWLKWETTWLALVDDFGIVPPFHCTEFEARKGEYADWSVERREEFRLKAVRTFIPPRYCGADSSQGRVQPVRLRRRQHRTFAHPPPDRTPWRPMSITPAPMRQSSAPAISHRLGRVPSTAQSHPSDATMYTAPYAA